MTLKSKKSSKSDPAEIKWPFGKRNYLVFALAVVVIAVGYITLGQGSITLAPILLVLGYCVLIPVALIIRGNNESEKDSGQQPSE